MEKLELKLEHLAPYLPYELQIQQCIADNFKRIETLEIVEFQDVVWWINNTNIDSIKPILRPLSDLTKDIEINGEKFVPQSNLSYISKDYLRWYSPDDMLSDIPYNDVQLLLEWHFDVFGLIEKGLAIDINSLPKEDKEL